MFKTYQQYSRAALLLMAAFAVLIISLGCSTLYKKVSQTPPLTTKDTFYLAGRCATTFSVDTVFKEGEILYITTDSTGYWQHIVDSIKSIVPTNEIEVQTKWRDSCKDALKIYRQGANNGYNTGYSQAKLESEIKYKDVFSKVDSIYKKGMTSLNRYWLEKYSQANTGREIEAQKSEKYRTKSENRGRLNMWLIIALALSILGNVLQFKKPKLPSFLK